MMLTVLVTSLAALCSPPQACHAELKPAQVVQLRPVVEAAGFRLSADAGAAQWVIFLSEEKSGLQLTVKGRGSDAFGTAAVVPMKVKKEFKERALQSALREGLRLAYADFKQRELEAKGRGVRRLTLSVQVNGVDAKAREYVERTVLPCLSHQLDLLGAVTLPQERHGFLELALEYAPAKDEPRHPLEWQVERMKGALLSGPRAACSVVGGPLAKYGLSVQADALNGAVLITPR